MSIFGIDWNGNGREDMVDTAVDIAILESLREKDEDENDDDGDDEDDEDEPSVQLSYSYIKECEQKLDTDNNVQPVADGSKMTAIIFCALAIIFGGLVFSIKVGSPILFFIGAGIAALILWATGILTF